MKRIYGFLKDVDGSISIAMVILTFVFVGFLAFVIDLAHLQTVKNELQNAADACALRGARAFLPDTTPITEVYEADPNPDNAKAQAVDTIDMNKSDNVTFQSGDLDPGNIEVGIWDYTNRTMLGWQWPPDPSLWGKYIGPGISLPTKRDGSVTLGPVSMTLARLFGVETVTVGARATAALSGLGTLEESTSGSFPIAVNEALLTTPDATISLSPDTTDVGGWTSLSSDNVNAATLKKLVDGTIPNPEVSTGQSISLLNGSSCSVIKEALKVYTADEGPKGIYTLNPPVDIVFPVVGNYKFNQSGDVTGFVAATILYMVDTNAEPGTAIPGTDPPQYTDGHCNIIVKLKEGNMTGSGGGAWYGLLSTEPKLVK